jgi:hypothetical protein
MAINRVPIGVPVKNRGGLGTPASSSFTSYQPTAPTGIVGTTIQQYNYQPTSSAPITRYPIGTPARGVGGRIFAGLFS